MEDVKDIEAALEDGVETGLVRKTAKGYSLTEAGERRVAEMARERGVDLETMKSRSLPDLMAAMGFAPSSESVAACGEAFELLMAASGDHAIACCRARVEAKDPPWMGLLDTAEVLIRGARSFVDAAARQGAPGDAEERFQRVVAAALEDEPETAGAAEDG